MFYNEKKKENSTSLFENFPQFWKFTANQPRPHRSLKEAQEFQELLILISSDYKTLS